MKYRVREIRKARGLTGEDLAKMSGLSKGYISQVETGKRKPGSETLSRIAEAFGITPRDLYAAETEDDQRLLQHLDDFQNLERDDQETIEKMTQALRRAYKP